MSLSSTVMKLSHNSLTQGELPFGEDVPSVGKLPIKSYMGAAIIIDECMDLWVSNGMKDLFCEVVVKAAALKGLDTSAVFDDAPGIAGTFGVSGVSIDADEFHPYFFFGGGGAMDLGNISISAVAEWKRDVTAM